MKRAMTKLAQARRPREQQHGAQWPASFEFHRTFSLHHTILNMLLARPPRVGEMRLEVVRGWLILVSARPRWSKG